MSMSHVPILEKYIPHYGTGLLERDDFLLHDRSI